MTYLLPNCNGALVEVWEWKNDYTRTLLGMCLPNNAVTKVNQS